MGITSATTTTTKEVLQLLPQLHQEKTLLQLHQLLAQVISRHSAQSLLSINATYLADSTCVQCVKRSFDCAFQGRCL